jgi:hypothetical protein
MTACLPPLDCQWSSSGFIGPLWESFRFNGVSPGVFRTFEGSFKRAAREAIAELSNEEAFDHAQRLPVSNGSLPLQEELEFLKA